MPSNPVLKIVLSLPLAAGEAVTARLPPALRDEARRVAASLLRSAAEVASSFADRAEQASRPVDDESADTEEGDDGLRGVHIE